MDYMYERLHIPYPLTFEVISVAGSIPAVAPSNVYSHANLALPSTNFALLTPPARCLAKHADCSICTCRFFRPHPEASRASTPASKASHATTGMRELGPDNSIYMRVGTQWVKVSPSPVML